MKKITQTSTLHGYKRTYFINQGEINGEVFIEITESQRIKKGKFIRSGPILIYLQDLEAVVEAMIQASTFHGYKRSYFINQGEINGEAFIEITESQRIEKGKFIRSERIRIYWQDLEAIVEALNKINEDSK